VTFVQFPHQINDPLKLRRVLQISDDLLKSGKRIDDASLGYTLFRKRVIRARSGSGTLAEQLKQIQLRAESDQAPLTIARDIRRLFLLFGFLRDSNGEFTITQRGRQIADARISKLSKEEKQAWLDGLLDLLLPEAEPRFHPVKIMLAILAEKSIETRILTFAFTAADDSSNEIQRIKDVASRATTSKAAFEKELASSGITAPSARNSVKIIPAIMEHVGLITRRAGDASLTPLGRTILDKKIAPKAAAPTPAGEKEPFLRIISPGDDLSRKWRPADVEEGKVEYDPQDDRERAALLKERTILHQATLDKLRRVLEKDWRLSIGNFDLLAEKGDHALLCEVKTIKTGSTKDERLRIIDGIGKLMFYERFDVPFGLVNKNAKLTKVMVFNRESNNKEHVKFLESLGISVLWFDDNGQVQGRMQIP